MVLVLATERTGRLRAKWMQAWLSQYPQDLGALFLTQELRSTSCEAVAWHGTTRREDEPLKNRSADCPPCIMKVGFTKGHLKFSLAEECKLTYISMIMTVGEYPCTWIDSNCFFTSKNSTLRQGPGLPWGYSHLWVLGPLLYI